MSNWDTSKVIYMNNIFDGYNSLISLPDKLNWNSSKVIYMNNMFDGCNSLKSLPDMSKWLMFII